MNAPPVALEFLAQQFLKASQAEAKAKAKKDELGEQLALLLGVQAGTRTHSVVGYKVVIEGRENVSLAGANPAEKAKAREALSALYEKAPVLKAELDPAAVKKLRESMPDMYALIVPYIVVKPGKPGVKVEKVEQ